MQTSKIIYETGATSHAVNDLILFTDNTRELAALRDSIYQQVKPEGHAWHFRRLLGEAIYYYEIEFKQTIKPSKIECDEYCQLFADDFNNWKQEHGIK